MSTMCSSRSAVLQGFSGGGAEPRRYRYNFDYGVGNFVVMDQSQTDQALQPECIVLGWKTTVGQSIRDGPPRGMGCRDFSGFGVQSGKNLIELYTYTFTIQSSNGNRILARPCLVTYKLKAPTDSCAPGEYNIWCEQESHKSRKRNLYNEGVEENRVAYHLSTLQRTYSE